MYDGDPYAVLGVTSDTPADQVKRQYRRLSRKYHPDTSATDEHDPILAEAYARLNAAYTEIERRWSAEGRTRSFKGPSSKGPQDAPRPSQEAPGATPPPSAPPGSSGRGAASGEAPRGPRRGPAVEDVRDSTWFGQLDRSRTLELSPPFAAWGTAQLWPLAVVTLAYLGVLWLCSSTGVSGALATFALLGVLLPDRLSKASVHTKNRDWPLRVILGAVGVASWAALVVFGPSSMKVSQYLLATLMVMALAGVIMTLRNMDQMARIKKLDNVISREAVTKYAMWGSPGETPFYSDIHHDPGLKHDYAAAEKMTARYIAGQLEVIPGFKSFHNLSGDDGLVRSLPHVFMVGNKVAFVESKMWTQGEYHPDGTGDVWRDDVPFSRHEDWIARIASAWMSAGKLPKGTSVRCFVIVWGKGNARPDLGGFADHANRGVYYLNSDVALSTIGGWLIDQQGQLNREMMATFGRMTRGSAQ